MKLSGIPKISLPKAPSVPLGTNALRRYAGSKKFGMPKVKTLGDYGKANTHN